MSPSPVAPITEPRHILIDAKDVAGDLLTGARRRTVISRVYYSAYHAALGRVETFAYDPNSKLGMHRAFIRFLRMSSDTTLKAVGDRLHGLYARRIIADYQLGAFVTKQMARDAIEDAEEIIGDLLGVDLSVADAG